MHEVDAILDAVYDKVYREWAAAKEIKVRGELNLLIFGHSLVSHAA